jgi:hypothetical protein
LSAGTNEKEKTPAGAGVFACYLRWRILARIRRFFRPTFRRPVPRRDAISELLGTDAVGPDARNGKAHILKGCRADGKGNGRSCGPARSVHGLRGVLVCVEAG